ncbi:class II fumarate hydratase [Streptomyces albus]|uniref:Fumarate hydratase class II n=1 Tax=Streptomyces albus TaxID=1888 RepID=A0A6C1C4K0_9ACTN|nr:MULTISPECIES: class II fumarate hydratase [Streptomyces]KPC92874.1 aspartate ammonia-lyase [Streptomyces sp. NRRL F-6602]EPD94818.1 fumarate hydratase class II [Streptomyces sp. HPH0547]MDI6412979.1 class II fumarate hydratase [Streptomyces albus]QID37988.1 class II fumarate hydratase [Streptomyces albus]TGG75585.1 class II fumarate hydratase [Streptomyces albus]
MTDSTSSAEYRTEHDSMGEVRVPAHAKWRAQTQRAVENFPVSGQRLERAHIQALARIKAAAAVVNARLGVLDQERADAVRAAAEEVADGRWDEHFPVDVFQTGSGTSSNMNMNEVLATLATERLSGSDGDGLQVHPNDHVNASQSSNDVFPSSIHIAATAAVTADLIPALEHLAQALERKAEEFADVVKSGRTHLMDATPVTLGQEFGGYAAQMRYGVERLRAALPRLAELPLGGTAVGTGINTPPGFAAAVIEEVARTTGLPLTEARDHFEAQGARDALVETSGQLRTIAVGLTKISNDLRWMSSGPRTGLAEIALPDLQPGSSIMPGKVNPVIPEAVLMVAAQVTGNDVTVATAGAAGNFELNVMLPVIAKNLLESIRLLSNAARLLADRTVDGITANAERAREYAESSPSVVTPLNKYIGYENAAAVAKKALAERLTIREAVLRSGYVERGELTVEQLDEALDVLRMTHP